MSRVIGLALLALVLTPLSHEAGGAVAAGHSTEKKLTLAELMREMTTHTEAVRARLVAGKKPGRLPKSFATLHTAEATSPKMKGEHFDSFATVYLAAARQLHDPADPEPKAEVFNRMIATCAACHTQYCPGPLARIKRLALE